VNLKSRVVPVTHLDQKICTEMFGIMQNYYDGITLENFSADLAKKSDVILLIDFDNGRLCGFSTLVWKKMVVDKTEVIGVFSGDTVLERKYWGNPSLGISFLTYLFFLKLRNFRMPVYWFLISKGYRTYLLMAKNFPECYPVENKATPKFEKSLMDAFYGSHWKEAYQPERGVISFVGDTCRLKEDVAPITRQMREKMPAIQFFERANPEWAKGEELACIAKMSLAMPFRYLIKKFVIRKVSLLWKQRSGKILQPRAGVTPGGHHGG